MSDSAVLSADWGRWAEVPTVMLLWGRSPWNTAGAQQNQPISREGHKGVGAGQGLGVAGRQSSSEFQGDVGRAVHPAGRKPRQGLLALPAPPSPEGPGEENRSPRQGSPCRHRPQEPVTQGH